MLVSKEGYEKLKTELDHLKAVERQKVADNIREAKSHGDLKENAMYHEAKLNQRRLDNRIADLEHAVQVAAAERAAGDANQNLSAPRGTQRQLAKFQRSARGGEDDGASLRRQGTVSELLSHYDSP